MSVNQSQLACRGALLTLLRRLHFYIGLFIGPFIFFAALTGTLYVLTPQIENALYHEALRTKDTGANQSLSQQIAAARKYTGEDASIFAVRPAPQPGDTTRVQFVDPELGESESRAIFVSPSTLAIQGDLTVYCRCAHGLINFTVHCCWAILADSIVNLLRPGYGLQHLAVWFCG